MNKIYFIADLHVGPYNNRTVSLRNFKGDWLSHTNFVRDNINETCERSDLLYILGDVGFKDMTQGLEDFLKSLRCRKKLVVGNHDSKKQLQKLKDSGIIEDVKDYYNLHLNNNYFHLTHYPLREWWHFFENGYHLYGHTHGSLPKYLRSMDVGIDNIGYKPINQHEVISLLEDYVNVDEYRKRIDL